MTDSYRLGVTLLVLGGTFAATSAIDRRSEEPLRRPLESIPYELGAWRGVSDAPMRDDVLASLAATNYVSRTYQRGSESLGFFVAYYGNQRAGESMHSPRHCLPGAGWEFASRDEMDLAVGGRKFRINRPIIQKDGSRMVVLYWYQSARRVVADEYSAKLFLIRDALVEGRTGGAIVRILCPMTDDATAGAADFAAAVFPEIEASLGGTIRSQ